MDLPPTLRSHKLPEAQRGLPLQRPGWPAPATPKPGERFEAMILTQLLATQRPAPETPLTAGQSLMHDRTTRLRAEAIARTSPLGITALIENAPK